MENQQEKSSTMTISSVVQRILYDQNLKLGHFQITVEHSKKSSIARHNLRNIDFEKLSKNTVKNVSYKGKSVWNCYDQILDLEIFTTTDATELNSEMSESLFESKQKILHENSRKLKQKSIRKNIAKDKRYNRMVKSEVLGY
jgi:hypothetical protein